MYSACCACRLFMLWLVTLATGVASAAPIQSAPINSPPTWKQVAGITGATVWADAGAPNSASLTYFLKFRDNGGAFVADAPGPSADLAALSVIPGAVAMGMYIWKRRRAGSSPAIRQPQTPRFTTFHSLPLRDKPVLISTSGW